LHELRAEVKAAKHDVFGDTEASSTSLTSPAPATHHGRTIANHLHNVCRQTRCETMGLEMLYNHTIPFTCPKVETFMLFMSSLPLHLQSHSHKFTLKSPIEEWTSDMFKGLPEFCRAYPRYSLDFYHPKLLTTKPLSILFTRLLVKYGARGETSFVQKITTDPSLQQRMLEVLSSKVHDQLVALIPGNLTFYPYDTFDDSAFRKACEENDVIRDVRAPTLLHDIDDVVAIAKDSYSHGFSGVICSARTTDHECRDTDKKSSRAVNKQNDSQVPGPELVWGTRIIDLKRFAVGESYSRCTQASTHT
jgi:hypothetical protein